MVHNMIMNVGLPEILLLLFIIVLLFGAKKLPDLARGMGEALREFRKAQKEDRDGDPEDTGKDKDR